jgi:uncharacterized protein (DUF488 family)
MAETVYTIGHSNGTTERLITLLQQHSVTAIADVRSQPYSRFNPQFNREVLASSLKGAGLEYVYLGQELGARSEDPACYRDGRAQYSLMAKSAVFYRGISRLRNGMERFRVAVMCAEKEPLACHRAILISRYLHENGTTVLHILEDGILENHETSLSRLLALHDMQESNLFLGRDELIAVAYEKQAEQIQYTSDQSQQTA